MESHYVQSRGVDPEGNSDRLKDEERETCLSMSKKGIMIASQSVSGREP